ncbi:hypothetical protein Tco_0483876 [Tanacetum coccineum]
MTGVMTELILRECMEKAQAKSSPAKLKIDNNVKTELSKKHLKELRNNVYSGTEDEDVVDHIDKVLKISNLIKTPDMDTGRLGVMDGMTKKALWHYWLKEEEGNELTDDAESSNEELKEYDYENPRNTDNDSFFKPYLHAQEKDNRYEIKKWNERNQEYGRGKISKVSPYSDLTEKKSTTLVKYP